MGYDLFAYTHLGITPLLAMCAAGIKDLPPASSPAAAAARENNSTFSQTEKAQLSILRLMLQHCAALDAEEDLAESTDKKHVNKTNLLEAVSDKDDDIDTRKKRGSQSSLVEGEGTPLEASRGSPLQRSRTTVKLGPHRRLLLFASAHHLLGRSSALHFAASQGKGRLCKQLLSAGCLIGALNEEGASPIHLACIAGDLETVKILLLHGADANAATLRGETPLILAVYGLHHEIVTLLLQQGADSDVVTKAEQFTVLHALAAGVLRQTTVIYRGLSWGGDTNMEGGARGVPSKGDNCLFFKNDIVAGEFAGVDLRIPSVTAAGSSLFLFPQEIKRRIEKGQRIMLLLTLHCNKNTYSKPTRKGLAAAELLLHMWENFQQQRSMLLQRGDLRFAPLSCNDRRDVEEQWHYVAHQVYVLRDMMLPPGGETGDSKAGTPRKEHLEERQHQALVRDAPWCFRDEIKNATAKNT